MPKNFVPLLFGALAFLSIPGSADDKTPARPNILLILADDLGFSDLGCYGSEIKTPHLNALAADGLRFTQFYNATRCCPTRASLLTGLYPHQAGVGGMTGDQKQPGYRGHLLPNATTLAEVLKSAGYRTFMVGKWHLGKPNPIERGFEEFYGMPGGFNSYWKEKPSFTRLPEGRSGRDYAPGKFYSTDAFADYSIDFINAAHRDTPGQPWFLYLAFNAPHFPLHAWPEDIAKYEDDYLRGWDAIRAERLERMKKLGIVPPDTSLPPRSEWHNDMKGTEGENPAWDSLPEDRRRDLARRMAVYAAMVDRMDAAIGRVVADLKSTGQMDNTLILFLSDNGACAEWDPFGLDESTGPKTTNILHTGEDLKAVGGPDSYISYGSAWANASNTPFRLYKHYANEGGISTPLIVHWPGHLSGQGELRTQPGHITDIMATLTAVSGAKYPAHAPDGTPITPMEGTSLLPEFTGTTSIERDPIFWEHEGNAAVRKDHWKLVRIGREGPWELYDMNSDRTELHNIAKVHPEVVKTLAADWEAWAGRTCVTPYPHEKRHGKKDVNTGPREE